MTEVSSVVLFSSDHAKAVAFYRAIGVPLAEEQHDGGAPHSAGELGAIHFAIYAADRPGSAPERRTAGSTFPGFYVDSLDEVGRSFQALGAPLLGQHEQMPWGCRIVVQDPDGRPVEINQRGHCA